MFRFCLIYGSILLVSALTQEAATPKRKYGPIKKIPGKNGEILISDEKRTITGEFGDQYGSPFMKIHSTKSVLNDGTQVLDLKCFAGNVDLKTDNSLRWLRKGPQQQAFKLLVAMSPVGSLVWPNYNSEISWKKYQQMKEKQMAESDIRSVSFTIHIPMEPCEEEGLFKCVHKFKRINDGTRHQHETVFHFNRTLVCGGTTKARSSPKHVPSAVATLLEDENVSYADLAVTEMIAIIGLVIILVITVICCVRRRKNAKSEKEEKEKKSDTNLPARRKSSRSRAGMSGSLKNLNSKSHLSPYRQTSYSSTGPNHHSPKHHRSRTSDMHIPSPPEHRQDSHYQSRTRMTLPSMGGPPPPPPPVIGGAPLSMGGPPPSSAVPPPQTVTGPAAQRPDRNALLASINARRVSSSNL